MAGALVAGAVVSGLASVVLDRLISPEFVNLVVGKKLDRKLVEKLKTAILAAEALVADAEQKQFGNDRVRKWLDSLRDALYTADDLLDRLFIKAEIRNKGIQRVRVRLSGLLNLSDRSLVTKIEEVVERIEDVEKRKDTLGLKEIPVGGSSWKIPSTSLVKGSVYGRDDDQQALFKMLHDNNDHTLSVISIVGLGGVGKTTLARWLYNNEALMEELDLKAWICVSEHFDVVETTKNVIKEINSDGCSVDSFELLQQDLKKNLAKKKFFIVLDDVWSEDADKWSSFITPFQNGRKGSTILVTTRNENVGRIVQHYNSYTLKELSDDYCWSIFADNASFPESNGSSELEEIGRMIVKKCAGLPLAAETLGRLCSKHDVEKWNSILSNDIWEFSLTESKIIPALLISYHHLPTHVKRCFVYCSLYPKDHKFDKDELILLWMAEDLLRLPRKGETLEEVGCECFDELASRLFFKQVENDYEKCFVMHDLMHDLSTFLAGKFYCRFSELGEKEEMGILTRHLSYVDSIPEKTCSSNEKESLRTLLYTNHGAGFPKARATLPCDILSKNKYLRVLSFDILNIFPDSIAKLIQLRYLDLSWSDIEVLPPSLCNLFNLQTLKLEGCSKLTMLPNDMYNLVNLRHLNITDTPLKEMPKGMGKLKQLHILSNFVVGKQENNRIEELGGLLNLHGSLKVQKLENLVDANQARGARITDKKHIEKLWLEWSSGDDMVSNTHTDEHDVLHGLQPHTGLKDLTVYRYKGKIFPDWLGLYSYRNMTQVWLLDCNNCCMLPSLGQLPSLKSLLIQSFGQLKSIGKEFYKNEGHQHSSPIIPFRSLETLIFFNMPSWEEWHLPESEAFPQLKSLQIRDCPMLEGDKVNQVLMRIVASSSDVSKVRQLEIQEDDQGRGKEMSRDADSLSISGFESVVESALEARIIHHLTCLEEIEISGCSSVVSLRGNCLPKSLQKLNISECSQIELLQQQKYDLVDLQMYESCDSLTSLSLDAFPYLENLEIKMCSNLESVSMSELPHAALRRLTILNCEELVSFPREGLAAPNLTHLDVKGCSKLEALPRDMTSLLPNLQSLDIRGCRNICSWSEGGLPPNLKELSVGECEEQLRGLSCLDNLNNLTHLTIYGDGSESIIKSYPEVDSLPCLPSLTTLYIVGFDNLETLECDELLRLNSLQKLDIEFCEKLKNMEGEKLPPSLLLLQISYCSLLGEHCKNKHQQIWSKISHIPTIKVNGNQIF
ncbi:putative disease resistance RPP13-like protein 1 [Arachis hypogaea]|uniref:putative disease resistance RPP13-like protein 1 n=1 Tax=Arachis hypogaea TaxID=3818 RepID=UPI000DED1AFB|nr:putative disease resistance RPP13-like protein 1 [Arachis hypogaea]XP_025638339.1 putative disease resistance RPP13-like protein 1 [Arachis hypogaea]QHO52020.1 Putative disease resistance RPP13-like protein [Arachis hypogaea]